MEKQSRTARRGASTPAARSNPAPPLSTEAAASPAEPSARDPAAPSGPASAPGLASAPDLREAAAVARWLEGSHAALLDLLAAAREGARRPRRRVLSRSEIRRQAREAFAQVSGLLDVAAEAMRRNA